jgi:hypothetical protein
VPAFDHHSKALCPRCSQEKPIYDYSSGLCRACYGIRSNNLRLSKAKQVQVVCSVCGKIRSSHLLGRAICQACWLAEQNGIRHCNTCGKVKVIYFRAQALCKQCYDDQLAPARLRRYVEEFTTPYPYDQYLFGLLVTTIRWDLVHSRNLAQIRHFGHFLQLHPLGNPLTWDAIDKLLTDFGSAKRPSTLLLRACLLDLGHLLAAQGLLERHDIYMAKRRALLPIATAPGEVQLLLTKYANALWKREATPADVRKHMEVLASFWVWCQERSFQTPEVISSRIVKQYLLSLLWQWDCSACRQHMACNPAERKAPKACQHCGTLRSVTKVRRYSQSTVRLYRSKLWVFFDWTKSNRLVTVNPVQEPPIQPSQKIQCYLPEVIRQLCSYVASPDADPIEGFVLYLILFHAFSTWELRHVQMPDLPLVNGIIQQVPLAEAYYVRVLRPSPSRGKHSPGRPRLRQEFPDAASSWLKPLLKRFEQTRQPFVENTKNPYVLIAQGVAHHLAPVSEGVVTEIVRRASLRILGMVCSPSVLRKTVATILSDQQGPGILHWLGWGQQQAFAYAWVPREVISPQTLAPVQKQEALPTVESITFPKLVDKPSQVKSPGSALPEENKPHGTPL